MATVEFLGDVTEQQINQFAKALHQRGNTIGWSKLREYIYQQAVSHAQQRSRPLREVLSPHDPDAHVPAIAYMHLHREGIAPEPLLPSDVQFKPRSRVVPVVDKMRRHLIVKNPETPQQSAVMLEEIASTISEKEIADYVTNMYGHAVHAVDTGEDPIQRIKELGVKYDREDIAEAMIASNLMPEAVLEKARTFAVPGPVDDPTARNINAPSHTEIVAVLVKKLNEGDSKQKLRAWLESLGIDADTQADMLSEAMAVSVDETTDSEPSGKPQRGLGPVAVAIGALAAWGILS